MKESEWQRVSYTVERAVMSVVNTGRLVFFISREPGFTSVARVTSVAGFC